MNPRLQKARISKKIQYIIAKWQKEPKFFIITHSSKPIKPKWLVSGLANYAQGVYGISRFGKDFKKSKLIKLSILPK